MMAQVMCLVEKSRAVELNLVLKREQINMCKLQKKLLQNWINAHFLVRLVFCLVLDEFWGIFLAGEAQLRFNSR